MENTRGKLTLDALPIDCLEYIFNKVDLETQIQISKSCEVFQNVLARMWRRNEVYHCVCIEEVFNLCGTDNSAYFLQNMHTGIQEIKFHDYMLRPFHHDVKEKTQIEFFPNVLTLEIIGNTYYDSDILLIKMFPNVRILKLPMATLAYLIGFKKLFQQLQELHFPTLIIYEQNDKLIRIFPDIFENLTQLKLLNIHQYKSILLDMSSIDKCQQLQVLKLNSNNLKPVLNKVVKLSNLKKLNVAVSYLSKTQDTIDFYYILENKFDKITGLAVDNRSMRLKSHWDDSLKIFECNKLRKFAFSPCKDDILEEIVSIKELSFLCFRYYFQVTIEKLLNILVSCMKLEHLDVAYCFNFNDLLIFLNGAMHVLRSQKNRKSLLTVYYGGITEDVSHCFPDIKKHSSYTDWTTVMNLSREVPSELFDFEGGYEIDFE